MILIDVFRYVTEKRYDSSTADMFINAFSSIFKYNQFIQISGSLGSYKTIRAGDNKRQKLEVSIISLMFL